MVTADGRQVQRQEREVAAQQQWLDERGVCVCVTIHEHQAGRGLCAD
eukprot:COSAG01_NODE_7714_length_3087_cov_29.788487_6_plen_47_part_00